MTHPKTWYGAGVSLLEQQGETASPRRVEEASLNAWPAIQQVLLDGWLLRFSRGFTRRANCIVPLYPGVQPPEDTLVEKVRYCENLYGRQRLQTIFRLTSIRDHGPLDQFLAARGYAKEDETHVMTARLDDPPTAQRCRQTGTDDWLDVYAWLTDMPAPARAAHAAILRGIQSPCAFMVSEHDGEMVGCGLGVLERELLGLFDIVTHPVHRRHGHGTRLVCSLLDWGREQRAGAAYLQVLAHNGPARALYGKLGFHTAYNYWYRISP